MQKCEDTCVRAHGRYSTMSFPKKSKKIGAYPADVYMHGTATVLRRARVGTCVDVCTAYILMAYIAMAYLVHGDLVLEL